MTETLFDKRRGFFMVENDVIDNGDLDVYEFKTYAVILRHANKETQSAFPSLNTLAKKVGCGKKKIVECIKSLIAKGYIAKITRKDDKGDNLSNVYHILQTPSISEKQGVVSEGNKGSVSGELGVVSEGNTNNTNLNKTKLTINNPRKNVSDSYSEDFENLWKTYPKKIDKKQGYKSFNVAIKKHSFEIIMSGVKGYADHIKRNRTETKFVKHASTFFNNECYLEYVEQPKSSVPDKPKQPANYSIDNLLD
ncbi:helix-turn-helix domain-containing protein [Bacillus thuringiensis]|uniref:helix-turn-helix domain-containing protein n=1 Tax=Bacillus thuringiensis TaxID=1428 RepID=UPI000BF4C4D8|nr:helix-turn-helix domain-containing protein [Bacillus thuringiensis]PEW46618.1 helix-turn-helix domain-containing protein [Bacillus thuringiensis]